MGVEGFSAESALLYHRQPPTAIVKAEAVDEHPAAATLVANRPLLPRHFRTHTLPAEGHASELYRNATGDELVYVESGTATFESVYGTLDVGPGDYVMIPTSTTHR